MTVPRQVDREAQGDRLSEAVWDVLAGPGLERLTLRAVAAAAGCTTGLVLHRFANRQALLLHARMLLHERVRGRVERMEREAATPADALRAILSQAMAMDEPMQAENRVWVGFLGAALGDDALLAAHRRANRAWQERIARLVASVRPELPDDEALRIARALIALTSGAATLAVADPDSYDAGTQQAMLDDALRGYGLRG
ncbi:MAG: TetR family transcriptional regulator C-terminal domain-containing protein [Thermomicrobiales bacterium]